MCTQSHKGLGGRLFQKVGVASSKSLWLEHASFIQGTKGSRIVGDWQAPGCGGWGGAGGRGHLTGRHR